MRENRQKHGTAHTPSTVARADGHAPFALEPPESGDDESRSEANLRALIESTDDLIWAVDLDFRKIIFNRALEDTVARGFGNRVQAGMTASETLSPERAPFWESLYARALAEGPFRTERTLPDGRTLELSLNPIPMNGVPAGVSVFGKDITGQKATEASLKQSEKMFRDIFDGALEGIFRATLEGRTFSANAALARMLGYDSPEEVVAAIEDAAHDLWVDPEERARFVELLKKNDAVRGFETRFKRKDGTIIGVSLNCRLELGADGRQPIMTGFIEDTTERKQAEGALRETAAFLQETQRIGGIGSYVLDIAKGTWTSKEVLDGIFGIDRDSEHSIARWTALLHPDDQAMIADYFANEVLGKGAPFEKEYRIVRQTDQAVRWVHGIGRLEFDAQGGPVRMRGVIKDVTERKLADLQLQESEERYRATFEQSPIGIVHTSLEGRFIRCNARFAEIVGYTPEEVTGMTVQQITAPENVAFRAEKLELLAAEAGKIHSWEKQYVRKDGSRVWARVTVSAQYDSRGRAEHLIAMVEDIDALKAAQEALRISETRYRTAFDTSIDAILINRIGDGTFVEVNPAFLKMLEFSRQEVMGKSAMELGIWADPADRQRLYEELARNGEARDFEAQFRTKSGRVFWGLMSASPIEIDGVPCALTVTRDITNAKAAEQRLAAAAEAVRLSEERYRKIFHTSLDPILISRTDNNKYIDVNQKFLDLMGFEREEVIGHSAEELNIWMDLKDLQNLIDIIHRTSECHNVELQFRKKNGDAIWAFLSASIIEIEGVRCLLAIARDVTQVKAAENEIQSLAFYDPLTGLPNRRLLLDRLRRGQAASNRTGRMQALLFVDLDNFKTLNDTLGHQTGDMMLQEVGRRLASCVVEPDTVARFGGDEFVVMLDDLSEKPEEAAEQARQMAEAIRQVVDEPYLLAGRECLSTSSIGITVFGDRREEENDVLQQADIAMYQAKAAGRNTVRFFAPALQAAVQARATMEEELRKAIRAEQFVLYYQPQVDRTGLIGAEALIRWNHPTRGLLAPGEFIGHAEETGLILPIGNWVLDTACAQIAAWEGRAGIPHLSVSVNISARQFRQPNFVEQVLAALDRSGANPRGLKLELTESMLADSIEDVIGKMTQLKAHGLRFSLDDFGTGYSSLAYLKRLPLDQLKIDRSFVRDILVDQSSGAIAQTIISLSRAMGMPVIAEGVETEDQKHFLASLGCYCFQGFLFSRPLPLAEFERDWLEPASQAFPVLN